MRLVEHKHKFAFSVCRFREGMAGENDGPRQRAIMEAAVCKLVVRAALVQQASWLTGILLHIPRVREAQSYVHASSVAWGRVLFLYICYLN